MATGKYTGRHHGTQHVTVEVTNSGDLTATNVQVAMEFVVDDEVQEADQVVDFLAGGESTEVVFVVDPAAPEDSRMVTVTGWTQP